jgi:hypothetical protein
MIILDYHFPFFLMWMRYTFGVACITGCLSRLVARWLSSWVVRAAVGNGATIIAPKERLKRKRE